MAEYGASADAGPSQPTRRRRTHKQRFSRSRTGCLTCRGRRIRCDETHPTCIRCTEIESVCTWPANVSSAASSQGKPSRAPSRHVTPTRNPSITDHAAPVHTTPYGSNTNQISNKGMEPILYGNTEPTTSWTTDNMAALSSLYDFASNDLGMPWNVNLEDLFPGQNVGSSAAIGPYYGSNNHTGQGNGDLAMPDWTGHGGMTNGQYNPTLQTIPDSTTLPFDALIPPVENAIQLNSPGGSQLAARRRNNSTDPNRNLPTTFPSFNIPHNGPISVTIPKTIDEPIEQVFPSADSKMIFQHVRSKTSSLIVALGLGDQKPQNPFMDMALRTILVDASSPAQTAFRHSMLSLGAAHVCYQFSKESPIKGQQMRVRTVKSKRKALGFLSVSLCGGTNHAEQTDLLLATCLTLSVRNTLCADPAWQDTIALALRHISRRGGPAALLAEPAQGCDRRFLLEQLAVADLFSTFTTGHEPSVLGQSAAWWEDIGVQWSESQWAAYEQYLGISRAMTEQVAKYRILHSRKTQLQDQGGPADAMTKAASEGIADSARALLERLSLWATNQPSNSQIKRVQSGDQAYSYMIEISILTEILGSEITDPKIQSAARSILELCSEMSQEPVSLLWPLLTAGACSTSEENRNWVRQLFDVFRPHYCQDLETAELILLEQWTRMDCGAGFTSWAVLMKDMGRQVCLK